MSWQRFLRLPAGPRVKWAVLVLWLLIAVGVSPLAAKLTEVTSDDQVSWLPRSAEATAAYERAAAAFPESTAPLAVVVYARDGGLTPADLAKAEADRAAFAALAGGRLGPATPSADGAALLVSFPLATTDGAETANAAGAVKDRLVDDRPDGLRTALTGPAGLTADLTESSAGVDSTLILITGAVVAIVLLVTYRSPVLWMIPLLAVGVASQLASAVVYLLARYGDLTVDSQGQGIVTVLVFGAGTDYALLLISRYREELRRHRDRHVAMAAALRAGWPAILASAATVIIALLCLLAAQLNSTRGMGPGGAVGVAAALLVMATLLPALLVVAGRWVFWPFVPRFAGPPAASAGPAAAGAGPAAASPGSAAGQHRVWDRVARVVRRRPRLVWIGTAVVLAASAVGMLGINTGLSQSDIFTTRVDSVAGQELITAHFPGGASGPAEILARADRADDVVAVARGVPGVTEAGPARASADGRWASIPAVLADPPDSRAAEATVARLRTAVHRVPGGQALVGGQTAVTVDTRAAANRDNLVVVPLILGVVLAVLVLLLRAVVAPLLLIASVVLSYAATMGLTTLLFQAIGYPRIDNSLPLLAFLFLVALGVDYTIFLMSRVREEAGALGTREGVLRALTVTGGVITSAGVVLAATFAVLTSFPLVITLHLGLVVPIGILLDTLVVRTLLVPALAAHLGEAIWWPGRPMRTVAAPVAAGAGGPADADDALARAR
jgi:RND superfamily putative drug exporter